MKRGWLIAGIVAGVVLMLGPLWGMLGTVFGMARAFTVLGQSGVADPSQVSASVSGVLISSVAGFVACPIGIVLMIVCIVQLDKAKRLPPPLPSAQN